MIVARRSGGSPITSKRAAGTVDVREVSQRAEKARTTAEPQRLKPLKCAPFMARQKSCPPKTPHPATHIAVQNNSAPRISGASSAVAPGRIGYCSHSPGVETPGYSQMSLWDRSRPPGHVSALPDTSLLRLEAPLRRFLKPARRGFTGRPLTTEYWLLLFQVFILISQVILGIAHDHLIVARAKLAAEFSWRSHP